MIRLHAGIIVLFDGLQELPQPLINMLQRRCPDLEELVIGSSTLGSSAAHTTYDILPLIGNFWPKLRILNLQHAEMYDWGKDTKEYQAQADGKAASFVKSVPKLHNDIGAWSVVDRSGSSLALTAVSEIFADHAYRSHPGLKELDLGLPGADPSFWGFSRVPSEGFQALATLTLTFDLSRCNFAGGPIENPLDHTGTLQATLRMCPQLVHLRILCETPSTLTFDWVRLVSIHQVLPIDISLQRDLLVALRGTQLQSLEVQKFGKVTDTVAITDIAAQLAVEYVSLGSITLRTMAGVNACGLDFDIWNAVLCSVAHRTDGAPWRVAGHEWYRNSSGIMASRRFLHDLAPSHHGSALMLEEGSAAD